MTEREAGRSLQSAEEDVLDTRPAAAQPSGEQEAHDCPAAEPGDSSRHAHPSRHSLAWPPTGNRPDVPVRGISPDASSQPVGPVAWGRLGPHRLAVQVAALSRPSHGFESRWGHFVAALRRPGHGAPATRRERAPEDEILPTSWRSACRAAARAPTARARRPQHDRTCSFVAGQPADTLVPWQTSTSPSRSGARS
jgi:hypothetical protein